MKKHSIRLIAWLAALSCLPSQTEAEEVSGIIIPRDNEGMYVRNEQGQFEVIWTPETKVALMANTRLLAGLSADQLRTGFWKGDNVHFGGETADALGVFLGEHVARKMGLR